MGDDIEDALAGRDSNGLVSHGTITDDNALMVPSWGTSSSSAAPVQGTGGTWADIGKTAVAGIVQGLFRPLSIGTPRPAVASASSGISTGMIVAGVAGVGLLGFLLMRGRSA